MFREFTSCHKIVVNFLFILRQVSTALTLIFILTTVAADNVCSILRCCQRIFMHISTESLCLCCLFS